MLSPHYRRLLTVSSICPSISPQQYNYLLMCLPDTINFQLPSCHATKFSLFCTRESDIRYFREGALEEQGPCPKALFHLIALTTGNDHSNLGSPKLSSVYIFCCYYNRVPHLSGLKQHKFVIIQFLWSEV